MRRAGREARPSRPTQLIAVSFRALDRLWALGNNGSQEPAQRLDGETIIGTVRLYTDGNFSTDDGRARFMDAPWRGLQALGKQDEMAKVDFLISIGRANIAWQSGFLDQDNDRFPYPFIEMSPEDMGALGVKEGDLVEVYNDAGATPGDGLSDADRAPRRDLHDVRLTDGPAGRCGERRGERAGAAELQADLGQHSQDRRRP
ncbi:MAG: molybdopterin dinucleotide binding domain-containing protein [Kiloniellaceae bacterium]